MKDGAVNLTGKKGTPYQGGSKASYTPSSSINEHSYGQAGGKAAILGSVPAVQVGNSFEVGQVPALSGELSIGELKNVSTPVSG